MELRHGQFFQKKLKCYNKSDFQKLRTVAAGVVSCRLDTA